MGAAACSDDSAPPPSTATGGSGAGGSGTGGGGGGANTGACVTAAEDIIALFKTDNGIDPVDGRSGGFYVYGDPLGMFDPPNVMGAAYPIDPANGNTTPGCSGPGSFRVKGTGFKQYGAAAGVDFMPNVGGVKGTYNASKYRGVTFWAKASAPLTRVHVAFPDVYTDGGANPTPLDPTTSPCVYAGGAPNNCSPYLVKLGDPAFPAYASTQIDTTWKKFDILFADTKQDQYNMGFKPAADKLTVTHLTGMSIQINAIFATDGTATANDFEIWIDDVAFLK
jgi:hypothetical protein